MKTAIKVANIASIIFLSTLLSYLLSTYAAEKLFFDKLIYKKSNAYGYSWCGPYTLKCDLEKNISERLKDLLVVSEGSKYTESNDKKPFKVVIIGDSMTYGLGIKQDQTFASILGKKLNQKRYTQVYNLSLPGDHIVDNYSKFRLAKKYLNADVYIFDMVDNDLYFDITDKYGNGYYYNKIKSICPGQELKVKDNFKNKSWEETINTIEYPSFSENYANICFLEKIANYLAEDSNKILFSSFFFIPAEEPQNIESEPDKLNHIIYKYAAILKKNGIDIINLYDYDGFHYKYKNISSTETHPSKYSHSKYADIMYYEITNNPKYEF